MRKKAIERNCKKCIHDEDQPGTWRKQVEDCTTITCDFFELRPVPYKKKEKDKK